jgi:hypothetical protein
MAVGLIASILSGTSSATTDALSVLGQRQNAGRAIQAILDDAQVKLSRTQFFNNVALRIEALRTGQIQPQEDWEKVAAYLATTGQPFVVSVDSKGQVQAQRQADTDLSRYNDIEKRKLTAALGEVDQIAQRLQANRKNQDWVDTLSVVPAVLEDIRSWQTPPEAGWQTEASLLAKSGIPFKIALNDKGELTVLDQTKSTFADAPPAHQRVLLDAIAVVRQTLLTGISDGNYWSAQAQAYSEAGMDYFLDVDPVTLGVVVKRNDAATIVPDFLREPPFPDIGADKPWKQIAADYIEQGKGFYLDLDARGEIVVRPNDGRNVNLYDQPRNAAKINPVVNLLA